MPATNCAKCGRKLSKGRLAANKRKCYPCECAVRKEQKQSAHDRNIESEDFTSADYWQLFKMQGGHCAIHGCRAKGKSKYLAVEHDHSCEMGHDPRRWCRVCVRGLTCAQHNEWIGRSGDSPEVFDSIASYLREPPALEVLMDKMIVGTDKETIATLHNDYKVPWKRAAQMIDLARGVGPSPTQVSDATIVVRYIRIPRTGRALYQIIESAPRMVSDAALKELMSEWKLSERRAKTALNNAWDKGKVRVKTPEGIVFITFHGRSGPDNDYIFSIEEQT